MPELTSLIADHDLNTMCRLAEESPPGCFVELGVYKGGSALRLYDVAERQGRVLHLFDTFVGHTLADAAFDAITEHPNGRFSEAIRPEELQAMLPNAVIHIGTFPETLTDELREIAFVHSDMDIYLPTRAACELLPPRMVAGGVMLFDDYFHGECPGVKRAVDEIFPNAETIAGRRVVRIPE